MFRSFVQRAAFFVHAAVLSIASAQAGTVDFSVTQLGGNVWRYDYVINNPSPSLGFDEVTIFFDYTKFLNLRDAIVPAGWDPFVAQPDTVIPANGFLDLLNLGAPLAAGASQAGFSITFDYLATGAPTAQVFDLLDSSSFSVVYSGTAELGSIPAVPEPGQAALLLLGLGWMFACVGGAHRPSR